MTTTMVMKSPEIADRCRRKGSDGVAEVLQLLASYGMNDGLVKLVAATPVTVPELHVTFGPPKKRSPRLKRTKENSLYSCSQ
jgi:hypothetical protein